MFTKILKPLIRITVCALLFTGCAARQNLLTSAQYQEELLPHDRTCFSGVWVVEDRGELAVAGVLRPKGMMRVDIPDYVEVALVDQSGAVIAAQKVAYYPRHPTGRKHNRNATFSARFAQMPPAGTTVRVRNVN